MYPHESPELNVVIVENVFLTEAILLCIRTSKECVCETDWWSQSVYRYWQYILFSDGNKHCSLFLKKLIGWNKNVRYKFTTNYNRNIYSQIIHISTAAAAFFRMTAPD